MADHRHPEGLDVITEALRRTPVLQVAIARHMMMDVRDLQSPSGQLLSAWVEELSTTPATR